jgi:uncharacterized protein (DUF2141 family)
VEGADPVRRGLVPVLAALLATPAFGQGEEAGTLAPGTLAIEFTGVKGRKGTVIAALFDSRAGYDADKQPMRLFRLPASEGNFTVTVGGLPPGRYGIKAFHDRDDSGTITIGPVGLPTEPYAFSNNIRGFGPAPWRKANFAVAPGPNLQRLRLM